jgi:hypothetical protein
MTGVPTHRRTRSSGNNNTKRLRRIKACQRTAKKDGAINPSADCRVIPRTFGRNAQTILIPGIIAALIIVR